jgi:hypothetical protein
MVSVFLRGGLGNQLFQYAAGLYLARRQSTKVTFRTDLLPGQADSIADVSRWPGQLNEFKGTGTIRCWKNQPPSSTHFLSKVLQLLRILGDSAPSLFVRLGILTGERNSALSFSKLPRIWFVDSYCASSTPALNLGEELRKQVTDISNPTPSFLGLVEEAKTLKPIMVHIRLGDYQNLKHLFGEPQYERIVAAVKEVNTDSTPQVWLFTDSPDKTEKGFMDRLGVSRVIGPGDLIRPIENLVLMSKGSALFCSNSTFSWWAAFLMGNEGSVRYPALDDLPNRVFAGDLALEGWRPY